jgi:hypothetical protein
MKLPKRGIKIAEMLGLHLVSWSKEGYLYSDIKSDKMVFIWTSLARRLVEIERWNNVV